MKTIENLKKVQEILGTEDVNTAFYAVSLKEAYLHLQGKMDNDKAHIVADELGIELVFIQENKWLKGERNGIEICLTM